MSARIEAFTTWARSTGPWWSRDTEDVVMDGSRQSFVWGRLYQGKDAKMELIQGGDSINDIVYLEGQHTSKRIDPSTKTPAENIQTGTRITAQWSYLRAQTTIEDQELLLNGGGGGGGSAQKYKSVRYQKMQRLVDDVNAKKDDECIGDVPQFTLQEAAASSGPRDPYSLHAFINEYDDGSTEEYGDGTTAQPLIGGLGGAGLLPGFIAADATDWTSIQTVDSRVDPNKNYRPFQATYGPYHNVTPTAAETAAQTQNLFRKLSEAFRQTTIEQFPWKPEYSDPAKAPNCIFTSGEGMDLMEVALRTNQSYFFGMDQRGGQDPHYNAPNFNRVPLIFISSMDNIALYSNASAIGVNDGTAGVTELDATALHGGPRFIGCNGYRYLMPFCHSEKHWEETGLMIPDGMPETRVKYVHLWDNILCRSRRRQFHLRPNDVINAP